MQKLQKMIDAAFGQQAERSPQVPSDAVLERERAFDASARKVEALREARMRSDGAQESLQSLTFDVVRHRGSWRVLHRSKHSNPFPDQLAAIAAAKDMARGKSELGHPVEVRLIRVDGRIVDHPLDHAGDQ